MANTGGRLIPALTAATVISAALLVLAVVVTGPVSLTASSYIYTTALTALGALPNLSVTPTSTPRFSKIIT